MKKFIIIIVLLIAVLAAMLIFIVVKANQDNQDDYNVYQQAEQISPSDLFTDKEGVAYYYFYADTCIHCQNIKTEIGEFYQTIESDDNISFYILNGDTYSEAYATDEDAVSKLTTEEELINYYNNPDNPKVFNGTPILVEVQDGVVTAVKTGEVEIPAFLQSNYDY